jgi:hypothetical protein
MAVGRGSFFSGEDALSEVIGFVLIIGIIMAAFSMYLVYGVPLQGRDNEINHMNNIYNQFVGYKFGIDSLWTNQQENVAMSTTFPLGTAAQTAQGSTTIIPVLQPVGSSGTLLINQRTKTPETFSISSTSYITNTTNMLLAGPYAIPTLQLFTNAPSSLIVNLTTKNAFWNNTVPGGVLVNGGSWNASINVTPNISDCFSTSTNLNNLNVTYSPSCYGSDITITVIKNGVNSLNKAIVYSNIMPNTPSPYSINLLDPAYGLQSTVTYPATMTFSILDPNNVTATVSALYNYQSQSYTYSVPLGSLEYSTYNNYWISQTYYYQMGGVFLSQIDGITYQLPPEITFTNNGNGNITINIVAIAYDPNASGYISGSSATQIWTSLKSDAGSLPYAPVNPNTWSVNMYITTPDPNAAYMWASYLNSAANQTAGIPTSFYTIGNTTTSSYMVFPPNGDGKPHITLIAKTANLSCGLQSVGVT